MDSSSWAKLSPNPFLLYTAPQLGSFNHLQAWKVKVIRELIQARNNPPSSFFPALMNFWTSLPRLPVHSWTTQAKGAVGVGVTGQEV